MLKHYPARLSVTTLTCFFGVIQFMAIAAFTERDVERWKIRSGEELLAILYAVRNSPLSPSNLNFYLFIFSGSFLTLAALSPLKLYEYYVQVELNSE